MNYQLHYDRLIIRAPKVKPIGIYTEKHHIIPRCMGGIDESSNYVYLTPEEHYVAHQLLVKIVPGHKGLLLAAHMMTVCTRISKGRANNKLYGWLNRKHIVDLKESKSIKEYHNYPQLKLVTRTNNTINSNRQRVQCKCDKCQKVFVFFTASKLEKSYRKTCMMCIKQNSRKRDLINPKSN